MSIEDIQLGSGEIMTGEEIGKLIEFIVNKFAEEGLSYEKAKYVLKRTEITIEAGSFIRSID